MLFVFINTTFKICIYNYRNRHCISLILPFQICITITQYVSFFFRYFISMHFDFMNNCVFLSSREITPTTFTQSSCITLNIILTTIQMLFKLTHILNQHKMFHLQMFIIQHTKIHFLFNINSLILLNRIYTFYNHVFKILLIHTLHIKSIKHSHFITVDINIQ